jgi:hypothetical protein
MEYYPVSSDKGLLTFPAFSVRAIEGETPWHRDG